jgi:hypothetical protein
MLAQNFKTATDLKIKDAGLSALIKVLGMLERGEIEAEKFNMETVGQPDCGTAGCILGWTRTIGIDEFFGLAVSACLPPLNKPLSALFYTGNAFGATREQAATALRSYLTTGDANWAEALAVS